MDNDGVLIASYNPAIGQLWPRRQTIEVTQKRRHGYGSINTVKKRALFDKLLQRKNDLGNEKERLVRFFAQGAISKEDFDAAMVGLGTELEQVDAELPPQDLTETELSSLLEFTEWLLPPDRRYLEQCNRAQ